MRGWLTVCALFLTGATSLRTRLAQEEGTVGSVTLRTLPTPEVFRVQKASVVRFSGDCKRPLWELAWDITSLVHGDISMWDYVATCLKKGKKGYNLQPIGLMESSWSVLNSISADELLSPMFCPRGRKRFSFELALQSAVLNATIRPAHGPCAVHPLELSLPPAGLSYLRLEEDIATRCKLGSEDLIGVRRDLVQSSTIHLRHMREKRLPNAAAPVSAPGGVPHVLSAVGGAPSRRIRYMSQAGQDEWVLETVFPDVPFGKGYFVELGAVDGVRLSNTYALEWSRGWSGICIEPTQSVRYLPVTRPWCTAVEAVVTGSDGDVRDFVHIRGYDALGVLAGIDGLAFSPGDGAPSGASSPRETRSLGAILEEAHAPAFIHYLSLDVEGAEWDILRTFPFHRYTFGALTVEHNRNETAQALIRGLLQDNDYVCMGSYRVDDYFVHSSVLERMKWREHVLFERRGRKPRRAGAAGSWHPLSHDGPDPRRS